MSEKSLYTFAGVVGSTLGGYLPSLLGAGPISLWGIAGAIVGGLGGIYLMYRWLH